MSHAPCLRVVRASVCTVLTPVPAPSPAPHRLAPGPGVLADINRLPLTLWPGRAGFPSLIRGPHWSGQTNTACDWRRGQLPCDQLTGMREASEELIMDRGDGDCQMTSCEANHCLAMNESFIKEDSTDRKCAWSHQQIHIRSGR